MDEQKLQIGKYENAILYFSKYCNNKFLGAVKLNKLMYYLDFISYRNSGKTVTGDFYIHKDYGPVPANFDEVVSTMRLSNKLKVERIGKGDLNPFKFEILVDPDLSVFAPEEVNLLKKICEEFQFWSTDKIVGQTHLEAPWFYSKLYDKVDFKYAKDIDFFTTD